MPEICLQSSQSNEYCSEGRFHPKNTRLLSKSETSGNSSGDLSFPNNKTRDRAKPHDRAEAFTECAHPRARMMRDRASARAGKRCASTPPAAARPPAAAHIVSAPQCSSFSPVFKFYNTQPTHNDKTYLYNPPHHLTPLITPPIGDALKRV